MKSILSNNCCRVKKLKYPRLMLAKASGNVALFSKQDKAFYVNIPVMSTREVGDEVNEVQPDFWEDYVGDVCLTNGEAS